MELLWSQSTRRSQPRALMSESVDVEDRRPVLRREGDASIEGLDVLLIDDEGVRGAIADLELLLERANCHLDRHPRLDRLGGGHCRLDGALLDQLDDLRRGEAGDQRD